MISLVIMLILIIICMDNIEEIAYEHNMVLKLGTRNEAGKKKRKLRKHGKKGCLETDIAHAPISLPNYTAHDNPFHFHKTHLSMATRCGDDMSNNWQIN